MSRTTNFHRPHAFAKAAVLLAIAASIGLSGCTAITSPINAVPADRVPAAFLGTPRSNMVPVDLARLRAESKDEYLLDSGDVVGIWVESIIGQENEPPPVQYPEPGSDLPPALGYPFPIREDGTVALPLVPPIQLKGLTLTQARELIRKAYMEDQPILLEDRIIVTLMKKRTVRVIVVRQDNPLGNNLNANNQNFGAGNRVNQRFDESSRGFTLDLPVDRADVLEALAQTGGLPGLNAKNEVKVLRGTNRDFRAREKFVADYYREIYASGDPCFCPPPLPEDPSVIRIPLRLPPAEMPQFTEEDIILKDGDIVYVEARDAEVFYAGGLLRGGEFPLPRDYDLDVLGAVALVGGSIAGGSNGFGAGGFVQGAPPQQLIVLRKTPCNGQIAIDIDLNRAINDPSSRILVQPGDTLILRYRPIDEAVNFGVGTFFTYGIRQLFRN